MIPFLFPFSRGLLFPLVALDKTVDLGILTEELFQCRIKNSALALLKSYLKDRYQRVFVGDAVSVSSLFYCIVPQGSILGPIMFLVYAHSLALFQAIYGVNGLLYADDCQIYLPIANIYVTKTEFVTLLSDIKTWMRK